MNELMALIDSNGERIGVGRPAARLAVKEGPKIVEASRLGLMRDSDIRLADLIKDMVTVRRCGQLCYKV